MIDISLPGGPKLLADRVVSQIDEATTRPGKYSWRIKPSSVGKDCVAANWYGFRWAKKKPLPGRIARIFAKGHDTEPRLMEYLRASGWDISEIDPSTPVDSKFRQWGFKALNGHMSAYADGMGSHPELTGGMRVLVEAKSYNKRRFTQLISKPSVKVTDFEYYTQVVLYLMFFNLPYAVFICECKDDGDIHVQIIRRDDETAQRALDVGHTVMTSRIRPARVAESPAFHACKKCDFNGVCHLGEPVDVNCRSCLNCIAIEGGKFGCTKWNAIIPNEKAILDACPHHEPIK